MGEGRGETGFLWRNLRERGHLEDNIIMNLQEV
jgi:hypothetical protein